MTAAELKRLFLQERALFARHYPGLQSIGLGIAHQACTPESPCRERDVAWCELDTGEVWLLKRALTLPKQNLQGLIRHELGHLADPWVHQDGAEHRADRIAKEVTGKPIRYDAREIQTIGRGGPRPRHLPR